MERQYYHVFYLHEKIMIFDEIRGYLVIFPFYRAQIHYTYCNDHTNSLDMPMTNKNGIFYCVLSGVLSI